jgi:hypothetical protein
MSFARLGPLQRGPLSGYDAPQPRGRDEAAHQSKQPTDQKASAQDAEAHAPQCAAG